MSAERLFELRGDDANRLSPCVVRWLSGTLCALLGMISLGIAARRMSGALGNPLSPGDLLLTGVSLAALCLGIRLGRRFTQLPFWSYTSQHVDPSGRHAVVRNRDVQVPFHQSGMWLGAVSSTFTRMDWILEVGTSLAVMILGGVLCTTGIGWVGGIAFWVAPLIEEVWAWQAIWSRLASRTVEGATRTFRVDSAEHPSLHVDPTHKPASNALPAEECEETPPENVTQQFVRCLDADGVDTLSGFARVSFSVGQRTGNIHLAFCPPFAQTPELAVEQLEGPEARIKTSQLLPYGARLEIKLAGPMDRPASVLLQFMTRESSEAS